MNNPSIYVPHVLLLLLVGGSGSASRGDAQEVSVVPLLVPGLDPLSRADADCLSSGLLHLIVPGVELGKRKVEVGVKSA